MTGARRRMIRGMIAEDGGAIPACEWKWNARFVILFRSGCPLRRTTVMRALPRRLVAATADQRDPRRRSAQASSVVSVGPSPTPTCDSACGVQGCAPSGRRLRRPWTPQAVPPSEGWYVSKLTLC